MTLPILPRAFTGFCHTGRPLNILLFDDPTPRTIADVLSSVVEVPLGTDAIICDGNLVVDRHVFTPLPYPSDTLWHIKILGNSYVQT